jgi:hypothetical protein
MSTTANKLDTIASIVLPPILAYAVFCLVDGYRTVTRVKPKLKERDGMRLHGTVMPRAGHTHTLIQSSANHFVTSVVDGHVHILKLSPDQMYELEGTGNVEAETDVVNGHSHTCIITI